MHNATPLNSPYLAHKVAQKEKRRKFAMTGVEFRPTSDVDSWIELHICKVSHEQFDHDW